MARLAIIISDIILLIAFFLIFRAIGDFFDFHPAPLHLSRDPGAGREIPLAKTSRGSRQIVRYKNLLSKCFILGDIHLHERGSLESSSSFYATYTAEALSPPYT